MNGCPDGGSESWRSHEEKLNQDSDKDSESRQTELGFAFWELNGVFE